VTRAQRKAGAAPSGAPRRLVTQDQDADAVVKSIAGAVVVGATPVYRVRTETFEFDIVPLLA